MHLPTYHTSVDGDHNLVTGGMAILAGETKENIKWALEKMEEAGLAMPTTHFSDYWSGPLVHFLDRGAGLGAVEELAERIQHIIRYVYMSRTRPY